MVIACSSARYVQVADLSPSSTLWRCGLYLQDWVPVTVPESGYNIKKEADKESVCGDIDNKYTEMNRLATNLLTFGNKVI